MFIKMTYYPTDEIILVNTQKIYIIEDAGDYRYIILAGGEHKFMVSESMEELEVLCNWGKL